MADLRVAVVGVGHLGRHHARIYKSLPGVALAAVCDIERARAEAVAKETGAAPVADPRELLGRVDAVSVATPTVSHLDVARPFVERGVAVLVEKPMTRTSAEGEELVALARARRAPLAVGHVERFNPAFRAVHGLLRTPRVIEVHRLSPFRFRSTDIDVVFDLMIHDLDIVLSLVKAPLRRLDAVGVSLLFGNEDIANARLEFENGTVANLTASRISDKAMRKIRLFSEDGYASVDTGEKTARFYKTTPQLGEALARLPKDRELSIADIASIPREFYDVREIAVPNEEPLANELKAFVEAARARRDPPVTGEDGLAALKLAEQVLAEIRAHRWS
jgi:predicted dehydrogenase